MTEFPSKTKPVGLALRLSPAAWWLREVVASVLWCAVFVQLALWNVAGYVVALAPWLEPFVRYRLLVGLAVVAVSALLGTRVLLFYTAFVALYPLVLIAWRLPATSFKNWPVLLAFSPAIHSILLNLKWKFVLFTVTTMAAAASLFAESRILIFGAIAFLAFYLCLHFIMRFKSAFTPSTVFAVMGRHVRTAWTKLSSSDILGNPRRTPAPRRRIREEACRAPLGGLCGCVDSLDLG
jgi:hypothetical protein